MMSTRCEFCDKRGLPLLLVRDAVAPTGGGAPATPGPTVDLPASAAHYTKRLLRSGYVYVHDEARKRWESYFVTTEGYLFLMRQTSGQAPVLPAKPFNCPDEGHRAVASCITVSDPQRATKIWIGFSDVLWTDAVQQAHADATYRKRHMVEVDVQAVLKSAKPHMPVREVGERVAEYALPETALRSALGWGPFAPTSRHRHGDRLKEECERLRPGTGAIVIVPDPAGIVQELALLMKRNAELFVDRWPDARRKLSASSAIDQIESAIRTGAEHTEIAAAAMVADQQQAENPLGYALSGEQRSMTESMRDVTAADLKLAADKAWKKYADKFDTKQRQAWNDRFMDELKSYDARFIAPLAASHAAWMKSDSLSEYFACNYDPEEPESGAVYTAVVSHCIATTQDKLACMNLYKEWLTGDGTDTRNLLLRAMIFNQKVVADAIRQATTVSIDPRQIPWDNLFGAYNSSIDRLSRDAQDVAALLVIQIAGPLSWALGNIVDGKYGLRGLIMTLGLIARHPVVVCEITGSRKEFRAHIIKQVLNSSGQVVGKRKMQLAIRAELKLQQIHGVILEGTAKRRWIVVASKEHIAAMPAGLSPQQRAQWLAKSLHTVDAMDQMNLSRWRTVINRDVRVGVITALCQVASLSKLMADEEKSLANENVDASRRLTAGFISLAGTTSELLGNVMTAHLVPRLRYGGAIISVATSLLKTGGRAAGIGAGVFVAYLDWSKAKESDKEGQTGLAVLYGLSALVGVVLTGALAFFIFLGGAAIPIIGALVVVAILIGLVIEYTKDNPIQDWLERCPWGMLKDQRYPDMATEQSQLIQALK